MGGFEHIALVHLRLVDRLLRSAEADVLSNKQSYEDAKRRLSTLREIEQEAKAILAAHKGKNQDV